MYVSGMGPQADVLRAQVEVARMEGEIRSMEVMRHAMAASSLSSHRVGSVDFMTLVDAQMAVNGFQAELDQLLADYGKALAALESAVGRTLSDVPETLTAARRARPTRRVRAPPRTPGTGSSCPQPWWRWPWSW